MVSGCAGACSAPTFVAAPGGGIAHAPRSDNPWRAREHRHDLRERDRRGRQAELEAKQAGLEAKQAKLEAKKRKQKKKHSPHLFLVRLRRKIIKKFRL